MLKDLRGRPLRWSLAVSCASAYLLFGYDQSVLGGLIAQPTFLDAIGNPSALYLGTIVSLYDVGCLAGCVVAAIWGNTFGRRKCVLWACSVMVIGATIQASCYGPGQLIAGRLISGLGNGVNTSTIGMYIAESSPAARRGRGVALQVSCVVFGNVIAYWLGLWNRLWHYSHPIWKFGRKAESLEVLSRLFDLPSESPDIQEIENEMQAAWELEQATGAFKWSSLLRDQSEVKRTRRLVLCFLISFFQMFTGINVIAFYVTIVLESYIRLSRDTSSLIAGFVLIAFWLGTIPPLWTLDRFGRRTTMIWGGIGLAVTLIVFTAGIAVDTPTSNKVALAFLLLFEIIFGMSWVTIPWIFAAEITPLDIRHIGTAVGAFSEWLCTFLVAMITPFAIERIGWKYYLLYCIMAVLAVLFSYFFVPETANKTLEEIDYIFCKTGRPPHLEHFGSSNDLNLVEKQAVEVEKLERGGD